MSNAPIDGIDVVVVAFNEEASVAESIAEVHRALGPTGIDYGIVLVDDGSSDATATIASRLAVRDARLCVKGHVRNKGMGAALRTGIAAGTRPYVTMLPADRQIRAEVLPALMRLAGPGIVVTSLYRNLPHDETRRVVTLAFRAFLDAALGPTPPLEGTWIIPRDLFDEVRLESETFTLSFEILHRAKQRGYVFRIARIDCHPREAGSSRIFNAKRIARVAREVLKLRRTLRNPA